MVLAKARESTAMADKIAVRASADGIQPKVGTAPRVSSESIGAVGRAQDAVEGEFRRLSRVGNTSLDGSDTRYGRAVVCETRWMVA